MSGHELSSIQGLEDKHLRALARQGVTDLRGLVEADLEVIYRGTANLRPRPPRGLIARWQDDASNLLAEASGADDSEPDASEADASVADAPGPDASGWQTAASFVVVFSQRRAGETWERQVEAEGFEFFAAHGCAIPLAFHGRVDFGEQPEFGEGAIAGTAKARANTVSNTIDAKPSQPRQRLRK